MYLRRKPYTVVGIRRVTCAVLGCTRPGFSNWNVCVDGPGIIYRAICKEHYIQLNKIAMYFVFGPAREADVMGVTMPDLIVNLGEFEQRLIADMKNGSAVGPSPVDVLRGIGAIRWWLTENPNKYPNVTLGDNHDK